MASKKQRDLEEELLEDLEPDPDMEDPEGEEQRPDGHLGDETGERLQFDDDEEDDTLGELLEIPPEEDLPETQVRSFRPEEERSPQEHLEHALSLAEMTERMLRNDYKDMYYRKALREIKPLIGTVPGSKKAYRILRRRMHNCRAKFRVASYRRACRLRDAARTEQDFRIAAEHFEAICKYDEIHHLNENYAASRFYEKAQACADSAEQAAFCRRKQRAIRNRTVWRRRGILLALAALAAGALLFSRTPAYMKLKGDVEMMAGLPDKAWQAYYESYRVTKNAKTYAAYQESRYQAALAAKNSDTPKDSWADWEEMASKDYLDSRAQFEDLERLLIEKAVPGKSVTFGGKAWTVLDSRESLRLLIRKEAIPEVPFQSGGGDCTWASSSIREQLNGKYLANHFSEGELAMISRQEIPAEDNRINGLSGGESTVDAMFLLSASEMETYRNYIGETKRCWWLRTPGTEPGTMAFVNTDKAVMDYGYDAGSGKIRIKPCIWIDTSVMEE